LKWNSPNPRNLLQTFGGRPHWIDHLDSAGSDLSYLWEVYPIAFDFRWS
jgi:hypothetical protein